MQFSSCNKFVYSFGRRDGFKIGWWFEKQWRKQYTHTDWNSYASARIEFKANQLHKFCEVEIHFNKQKNDKISLNKWMGEFLCW